MRKGSIVLIVAAATSLVVVAAATLQNVAGNVTGSHEEPLPGFQVSFLDAVNAELLASVTTDANGNYDSGNIPIGDYRVRFSIPNYSYDTWFYALPDSLETGSKDGSGLGDFCSAGVLPVLASTTTVLDSVKPNRPPVLLGPPAAFDLGGTVVDAATGLGLPGIRVDLLGSWDAESYVSSLTDADGHFSAGWLNGSYLVRIRFSDPAGRFFSEFYGADSDAFCGATVVSAGSSIEGFLDRVPPEQLTQHLADTVASYDLPASVATMLGTSLTQLRGLLADGNPGNDSAACGQLASFASRVAVQERRGELSSAEASELRSLAANLGTALGCH